ncbi:MAG: DUF1566 domain-containing protein [Formivibrio sp.]|nr:DUF1566 domain-containing protein [Formivibrio sp.]
MNHINKTTLPAIGSVLSGGFFAGLFRNGDQLHALIVSPKAEGEFIDIAWGEYPQEVDGADSCFDGRSNTLAMAAAGSGLAKRILALRIADLDDWYLPSRDELEICYRNLKPTTEQNWCSFRDGDNASSVPVSYPYTKTSPAQTSVEAFQQGNAEAFEPRWHWSSTQYSAHCAFFQYFDTGHQCGNAKGNEYCARAVRRLSVIE